MSAETWNATLNRAILGFYEPLGGIQKRMFIDIDEDGRVIGADIVCSGKTDTWNACT